MKGVNDEMDRNNSNDFRIRSSDHEWGHVMQRTDDTIFDYRKH